MMLSLSLLWPPEVRPTSLLPVLTPPGWPAGPLPCSLQHSLKLTTEWFVDALVNVSHAPASVFLLPSFALSCGCYSALKVKGLTL